MAGGTLAMFFSVLMTLSRIAGHWVQSPSTCTFSESGGSIQAHCSHLNLSDVPQNLPDNLIKLDLSYNKIVIITNASFVAYEKIQSLLLQRNALNQIKENSFELLLDLRVLDLSYNNISRLPDALFHNNVHLSILDLSYNRLIEIPNNALGSIKALRNISLSHNLITNISFTQFSSCHHLSLLDLTHNKIVHLHNESFATLRDCSINELNLTDNKLSALPQELFSHFHHLKHINLNNTNLLKFDMKAFMGNYNITQIWIKNANIYTLQPLTNTGQHADFPSLEAISLQLNKLSQIQSNAFWGFKNLRFLDLESNRLVSITNASFCGLSSLILT
ncbi:uncharacterized protein [Diadema antillarum]|uniref:uncharacterized protein n=1 Tax=Diadema antillarum TaxID=105358 RepID=UPI003A83C8AD